MSESELRRERLRHAGWIGIDLDGTLLTYDTWVAWNVFGEPIPPMVERVRRWLFEEREVRIVTARVGLPLHSNTSHTAVNTRPTSQCRVTEQMFSDAMMVRAIQEKLAPLFDGHKFPVQCYKDWAMIELWDDRAVQVVPNTGQTLAESHEAEVSALRGRAADIGAAMLGGRT